MLQDTICIDMLHLFLHGLGAIRGLDLGLVPHQPPLSDDHLALLAHRLPELVLERPAPALLLYGRQALSPLSDAGERGVHDLARLRQCWLGLGPRSDVSYTRQTSLRIALHGAEELESLALLLRLGLALLPPVDLYLVQILAEVGKLVLDSPFQLVR